VCVDCLYRKWGAVERRNLISFVLCGKSQSEMRPFALRFKVQVWFQNVRRIVIVAYFCSTAMRIVMSNWLLRILWGTELPIFHAIILPLSTSSWHVAAGIVVDCITNCDGVAFHTHRYAERRGLTFQLLGVNGWQRYLSRFHELASTYLAQRLSMVMT
jgi:hypothetical protein